MQIRINGEVRETSNAMEITPQNYVCPKGEEQHFHCLIEIRQFDQKTGERMSRPRVQKFPAKDFEALLHNLRLQGYDVTILHNAKKWIEDNKAKIEKEKKAAAEKAAKEAAARREAEKEALKQEMKAEIMRELKDKGMLKTEQEPADNIVQKPASKTKK